MTERGLVWWLSEATPWSCSRFVTLCQAYDSACLNANTNCRLLTESTQTNQEAADDTLQWSDLRHSLRNRKRVLLKMESCTYTATGVAEKGFWVTLPSSLCLVAQKTQHHAVLNMLTIFNIIGRYEYDTTLRFRSQ